MKLKSLLLASMILGASVVTQASYAADASKTQIVTLEDDGLGGYATTFGHIFNSTATGATFTDTFKFTLSNSYDSSASLTSLFQSSTTVKDLDITGYVLKQYDPISNLVLASYTGSGMGGAGVVDTWTLDAGGLVAGSYRVEVSGKVLGSAGGTYTTDLSLSPIAAVPEPETYGMLLAGMGVVGFLARRKRKQA